MNDSILSKGAAPALNSRWFLLLILLLAVVLRMLYIGNHSLWVDELFSLKFASYSLPELFREVAGFDNHPPLYYLVLHFWIQLFGDSELSLRTPSMIFSVLSVYVTCKTGELLFNRWTGLIAALLLAVSGFSINYAQEARMYSLLALLSVLSVYFLLKLQNRPTPRNLFHYIWSTTLLVYTHLYGIFIIIAENLYVLAVLYQAGGRTSASLVKKWLTTQGAIFLLSLPWFVILVNRILNLSREGFWVEVPDGSSLLKTFAAFSGTTAGLAVWCVLLLTGVLAVFLVRYGAARKILENLPVPGEGKHVFLLLLLLGIPVLLPYLLSQVTTPIYIVRSAIASQFAFMLLVANGIAHLRWRYLRYAALGVLLLISSRALTISGYVHHNTPQYRESVAYLAAEVTDNGRIVFCDQPGLSWPIKYYASKAGIRAKVLGSDAEMPPQLDARRLWFIRRTDLADQCDGFSQSVADRYLQVQSDIPTFRHLQLTVFAAR